MLLTIDIGNSNIVCGLFQAETLIEQFRITTEKDQTEAYFREKLLHIQNQPIDGIIIGSVVPQLDTLFTKVLTDLFAITPLFASTQMVTGIDDFSEVVTPLGADLLVNIVAAREIYPGNSIIVDLGTASKFQAVSGRKYLGGAIAPGIGTSFDALFTNASLLTRFPLQSPVKVLGDSTEDYINSGYIFGFAGLVDGMVTRIQEELTWESAKVIGTGGYMGMIVPYVKSPIMHYPHLTLYGLRLLWEKNT